MSRRAWVAMGSARAGVVLAVVVALVVRLVLWSQPLHQLANDEVEYVAVARDLLAGRGWQFYTHYHWLRAPLYPLFLAGSLWLAGGDLHRAALPNIALSVFTVGVAYRLALVLVGQRAALLAALLTAVLWTFATFASLYMAETLWTFLFSVALLCLLYAMGYEGAAQREQAAPRWGWLVGAGVCFGLATLTRSITLMFLPFVALWLLFELRFTRGVADAVGGGRFQRIFLVVCFVGCTCATIAPWSVRNYLAYGRLIPVETGLSFNLWAFNEPHEDIDTIFHTLESIANPAERSDYATARGLARLREDPAIVLRKLWPNWGYLWRVKPIEDRFIQTSYYADVGFPLFVAALFFDDAFYFAIVLAAVVGGVCVARDLGTARAPRWLLLAWVLYVIVTVLLTHGEARYRHFLFPVLIPYAAWCVTQRLPKPTPRALALIVSCWAVFLAAFVPAYPWGWASHQVARGWWTMVGDSAWYASQRTSALDAYQRAVTVQETPDAWLRVGDAARATGDQRRALAAYRAAVALAPPYPAAIVRYGDLLRELGALEQARSAFVGDYADARTIVDWAWRDLIPSPRGRVDVGDGLDFGYIGGVYPAESLQGVLARWSDGDAMLRLVRSGASTTALLRLRIAAPRPDGLAVPAHICASGRCWSLTLGARWRTVTLVIARAAGEVTPITIASDTFLAPDGRQLGVLIDWAEIMDSLPHTPEGRSTLNNMSPQVAHPARSKNRESLR